MSGKRRKPSIDGMIADMTRDLTSGRRKSIKPTLRIALAAFGVKQLQRMRTAGVRVWPGTTFSKDNGMPPPFQHKNGDSWIIPKKVIRFKSQANYEFGSRVIFYHDKVTNDEMRHELVHAWDHVRTVRRWKRFDDIKTESNRQKLALDALNTNRSQVMWSAKNSALNAAFRKYKTRAKFGEPEKCFDNPQTVACYSRTSIYDFYAEAYSVFHGTSARRQERMRKFAPEVFELLSKEAIGTGISAPSQKTTGKSAGTSKTGPATGSSSAQGSRAAQSAKGTKK